MSKRLSEDIKIFESYVTGKKVHGDVNNLPWVIKPSPFGGRGIFAKKPIPSNELLFIDPPLVLGPRSDTRCQPICVGCHRACKLITCSKNCGFPVCGLECEKSQRHKSECELLNSWKSGNNNNNGNGNGKGTWDKRSIMCLAPIRCLFLNESDLKVLESLEGHKAPQHELIIKIMKDHLNPGPDPNQLKIIQIACEVLDATAFETVSPHEKNPGSLRGIYPLAAIMNHNCSPNTRHSFDSSNNMIVESCREIQEGEEITTTYTSLIWGNQARHQHLSLTKKFQCDCERCGDPAEFGARLQALYCLKKGCTGVLLPMGKNGSGWCCVRCGYKINAMKIGMIQSMIGNLLESSNSKNLRDMCNILKGMSVVPNSNQMAMDFKLKLVWLYGNKDGYHYPDLTDDELILKELLCRELLMALKILKLGDCRLKADIAFSSTIFELKKKPFNRTWSDKAEGLILIELHYTIEEVRRRHGGDLNDIQKEIRNLYHVLDDSKILKAAKVILRYDFQSQRLFQDSINKND